MSREATLLIAGLTLATLLGVVALSDGFALVDEVIYFLGAYAIQTNGTFFFSSNGFEQFGSDGLKLRFLSAMPEGLTPQYPPGTAILGAGLMALFGLRGLVVLNALATVGTLITTYFLTKRLFSEQHVATAAVALLAFCTFLMDYAFGYWPHAVSVFLATLALLLFLPALDNNKNPWRPAFLAGLVAGVSMHFRVDGILILPTLVFATVLFARRPFPVLTGGLAGLVPGILALAYFNLVKFDVFNPITYGQSGGGGTSLSGYLGAMAVLIAVFGGLAWMRMRRAHSPVFFLVLGAIVITAATFSDPVQKSLHRFFSGIWFLLFYINDIPDARNGMSYRPDGTTLFWGIPKKALAQSLPWIGILFALFTTTLGKYRRSVIIVLMFSFMWSLPFLLKSWHGGFGANMRYLLPTLPALCALAAWVASGLYQRCGNARQVVFLGACAGFMAAMLWTALHPTGMAGAHQLLSFYCAALVAALALFSRNDRLVGPALAVFGMALGYSSFLAISDMNYIQQRRSYVANVTDTVRNYPNNLLILDIPEKAWPAILNPTQLVAVPEASLDADFINAAFASGKRVLLVDYWRPPYEALGFRAVETPEFAQHGLLELLPE